MGTIHNCARSQSRSFLYVGYKRDISSNYSVLAVKDYFEINRSFSYPIRDCREYEVDNCQFVHFSHLLCAINEL